MLDKILFSLSTLLNEHWYISIIASFLWGVLTVILGPCNISSIPLIMAFISGKKDLTLRDSFRISLIFSCGILISLLLIGFLTLLAGRMIGDIGIIGYIIISIVFLISGLNLMGLFIFPDIFGFSQPDNFKYSSFNVLKIGFLYGIAVGPCTFAFLAPILSIIFKLANKNLIISFLLFIFYCIGYIFVYIIAGTISKVIYKYVNNNIQFLTGLKVFIGLILIFTSIYLLYNNVLFFFINNS